MHRNMTFAGIFLIFSIANVVLAAPALIRQRHFRADDEPTGESKQDPARFVHEEVEPAASPPSVGLPEWWKMSPTASEVSLLNYLAKSHSDADSKLTVLPSSQFWHQGSSSPEQDPAELAHEEVKPVATPPPVGSPEKSLTSPGLWSDKDLMDYMAKNHLSGDPSERTVLPSSPFWEPSSPGLLDAKSPWWLMTSGSPELQKTSGSPELQMPSGSPELQMTSGSPGLLEDEPQWWLKTWQRPPSKWEAGESYTAPHGQMLPPASVAQPMHNDAHESDSDTDIDKVSMMSWSSRVSGWEEEAKNAEELHPHL